ncbi:MAG: NAD(+) diphosphatase [Salinarimonas sp.]|nr:NAD(+) diphosphatase [Salinarimonas sp.]
MGFATNGLVRHTSERGDDARARHRGDPQARIVLFAGDTPILSRSGDGLSALHPAHMRGDLPVLEEVYLGTLDGTHVLALLTAADLQEQFEKRDDCFVLDLRSVATQGLVPELEAGILAEAKSLLSWHARHRFCANCGAPTRTSASGFRRDCDACGTQHFPRTDPVAIMLITHGDNILLGRQARFPTGNYSCLAGFVEPGETVEDAVRRETFEEAGVRVGEVRYVLSQPWPFPSSLMIGCHGIALDDRLDIDYDEMEDVRWFSRADVAMMLEDRHPDNLRTPPPVAIAHHLVRRYLFE